MDLVQELQTNYPTAEVGEIVSGRRIIPTELAEDLSNIFYSESAYYSTLYSLFSFVDPYNTGTPLFTLMDVSVGTLGTTAEGNPTINPFAQITLPSVYFSGKKISVNFTESSLAEIYLDGVLVASEESLTPGEIGIAYGFDYPFERSEVGEEYNEQKIRPIKRGGTYVFAYDGGGCGADEFRRQSRLQIDQYRLDPPPSSDQEILTETLYLLGLDWLHQFEMMVGLLGRIQNFTAVTHHTMVLIQQEAGFGVDIPTTTLPISNNENTGQNSENQYAMFIIGSAMEHGVIEQSYPDYNAVSTVRYVRDNNLAGGKTYYATPANYDSVISTDSDFIAGWDPTYRNEVFQDEVDAGSTLILLCAIKSLTFIQA